MSLNYNWTEFKCFLFQVLQKLQPAGKKRLEKLDKGMKSSENERREVDSEIKTKNNIVAWTCNLKYEKLLLTNH